MRHKKIAISINDKDYSYGSLVHRAQKIANLLREKKIARVGILASRSITTYSAVWAAITAGITYVPLDPRWPIERIKAVIQQAEIDTVVVDADEQDNILQLTASAQCQCISFPFNENEPCNIDIDIIAPLHQSLSGIVCILFTSGSTGKPKGIPISAENILCFIKAMQHRYQLTSADRVAQFASLSFDMSLFEIMMTWQVGATLYVVPESELLFPAQFIQRNDITVWYSVPSVITFLQQLKLLRKNSFPSLKYSLFAGEALMTESARRWQQAAPQSRIENLYGPTETNVCLIQRYHDAVTTTEQVPIGEPVKGLDVALLSEKGTLIEDNEAGELVVSGPQVVGSYWRAPELTSNKFIMIDQPCDGKKRWYLTGDRCYRDDKGVYHYLGRLDNQVKIQGYRVELEEVECYLRKVSGCLDVAVIARRELNNLGVELYGFIAGGDIEPAELKVKLLEKVPYYMVPKQIFSVNELPRNTHGKVDRAVLAEHIE